MVHKLKRGRTIKIWINKEQLKFWINRKKFKFNIKNFKIL